VLTIFALPKPFEGQIGSIQRNAIRSWKRLGSGCQVIICGDEVGFRDVAAEFGIERIVAIERNEFGTPLLSSAFRQVEEQATHDLLCYANADLIFFRDLLEATRRISSRSPRFLLAGRAWDLDVEEDIATADEDIATADDAWEANLRRRVSTAGAIRGNQWIDFFVFRRSTIGRLPAFTVGRPVWDNWMIWRARSLRLPVIDISPSTLVIHQKHDYSHVKEARGDRWEGPEGDANRALLRPRQFFTLEDATYRLEPAGIVRSPLRQRLRGELLLRSSTAPLYLALRSA
jgi:hypothetical protein